MSTQPALYDVAGQERFKTATTSFYRASKAVILMYDVTTPATFEVINGWHQTAKNHCLEDTVYALVGCKIGSPANKPLKHL